MRNCAESKTVVPALYSESDRRKVFGVAIGLDGNLQYGRDGPSPDIGEPGEPGKGLPPGYLRRFPYDSSHCHIKPLRLNNVPTWWLQISDCEPQQHRFTGYFI